MKGILDYTKPRDRTGKKKNALLMNELLSLSLMLLTLCRTKRISALILCHLQKKLKHSYHEKSHLLPNNLII